MRLNYRGRKSVGPFVIHWSKRGITSLSTRVGPVTWNTRTRRVSVDTPGPGSVTLDAADLAAARDTVARIIAEDRSGQVRPPDRADVWQVPGGYIVRGPAAPDAGPDVPPWGTAPEDDAPAEPVAVPSRRYRVGYAVGRAVGRLLHG